MTSTPCPQVAFRANDGNHPEGAADFPTPRTSEASSAYALLQQRRLAATGDVRLPCPWELARPVQSVAIILEAAGEQPSAVNEYGSRSRYGYSLACASQEGQARISYKVPATWEQVGHPDRREADLIGAYHYQALQTWQLIIEEHGWQCERHHAYGRPFLIARPRQP